MYFSVHHKLAACLGFMTRRLFLMPHPTAIGNASEDYLFGLIYAVKHKRKLVLIMPHQILSVTGLKMFSYDLFYYSNQEVAINHSSGKDKLVSFSVSSYFFTLRLLAKILFKLLKIKLPDVYYHPSLGHDIIWQPRGSRYFDWTSVAEIDLDNLFENKKLKLEKNFYNVFRNTIRILLNDYKNIELRENIEKELNVTSIILYATKLFSFCTSGSSNFLPINLFVS